MALWLARDALSLAEDIQRRGAATLDGEPEHFHERGSMKTKKVEAENPYEYCPCGRKRSLGLTPTTIGFWCGSCGKTVWIDKALRPKEVKREEKSVETNGKASNFSSPNGKEKQVCRISKQGDAIFTAKVVKKEISRNFSPQSTKVTVVSKSTGGTRSESTPTRTTTQSSVSAAPTIKRVTTTPSERGVISHAGDTAVQHKKETRGSGKKSTKRSIRKIQRRRRSA